MNDRRRATVFSVAALALVTLWYGWLLAQTLPGRSPHTNARTERTERFGSDAYAARGARIETSHALVLAAKYNHTASATWDVGTYEFRHLLARTRHCRLSLYINGLNVAGDRRGGRLTISTNGRTVARARFSRRDASLYRLTPNGVPEGLVIRELELAPLDRVYVVEVPLGDGACSAPDRHATITLERARWRIESVGLLATFQPPQTPLFADTRVDAFVALLEIAVLAFATYATIRSLAVDLGFGCALAGLAVLVVAPLAHDQWDFEIWPRFVDVVAFAHANPAGMWQGTPLWAFLPALLAPVLTASYRWTGNGTQDLVGVFLKFAMALAYVHTARRIATSTNARMRSVTFAIFLASPIALYQLAGGYREVFAGALFVEGLRRAYAGRPWLATACFVCAASITESLFAFVAIGAGFHAVTRVGPRRFAAAGTMLVAGFAAIALEWILLVPHDLAAVGIANRIVSYRFGGASWYGALDALGVLPTWAANHSLQLVAAIAVWPTLHGLRVAFGRSESVRAKEALVRDATLVTIAFFLGFRGVDPNTWYALFVVVLCYFTRYRPASPVPLVLGCLQGLTFYAIVGLRDFVNESFLFPRDVGLFGTLGTPVDAFVLATTAFVATIFIALVTDRIDILFGRNSKAFAILFVAAIATSAIRFDAVDVSFFAATAFIAITTFGRLLEIDACRRPMRPSVVRASLGLTLVAGALLPSGAVGRLVILVGFVLALGGEMSLCDAIFVIVADGLAFLQPGFGWFSICGWIGLSLLASYAIARGGGHGAARAASVPVKT